MDRLIKPKERYSGSCNKQFHNSEGVYRNPGSLMTNPEREMRRKARSPFYRRIPRGGSGTRSLETKPEMVW